ncbi:response regulator [Cytophagales bacterium WSM2-2]|nr:response regulator [Cytophagales bacterium WSM2-2]
MVDLNSNLYPVVENENSVEVVIVEDSIDDSELTRLAMLQASDSIRFRSFTDGLDALNFIYSKKKYEGNEVQAKLKFVILDIGLPTISGLDMLKKIREEAGTKKLPVIILTNSIDERDMNSAYELGANSYVVKPNGYYGYIDKIKSLAYYWGSVNEKFH